MATKIKEILHEAHGEVMGKFVVARSFGYQPYVTCRVNSDGVLYDPTYHGTEEVSVSDMNERVSRLNSLFTKN